MRTVLAHSVLARTFVGWRIPSMLALAASLSVSDNARAQKLDLGFYAMGGSGLSAASGDGETLMKRSPFFLDFEVGVGFDYLPGWEWTAGFITELEGRTSFGINPQVKRVIRRGPLGYYATGGVPMFFTPFTLMGFEIGGGVLFFVLPRLALVLELRSDFFFVGSDLQEDAMLAKFDGVLGLRIGF